MRALDNCSERYPRPRSLVSHSHETGFLLTNVPSLAVQAGTFEAFRIPDDSDCSTVRRYFDR